MGVSVHAAHHPRSRFRSFRYFSLILFGQLHLVAPRRLHPASHIWFEKMISNDWNEVTTLNLGDVRMTSVTSEMTSDRNDGSRVVPYRARAPYGDNGVPGSRSAASGFLIQTPGQYKINKKLCAVPIEIFAQRSQRSECLDRQWPMRC